MVPHPDPEVVSVCCAIIERKGQILIAQRGRHQSQAGKWEFPGGKIEAGETPREALIREIKEELGCRVEPFKQLEPNVHRYETITIQLIPYHCRLVTGFPIATEHAAIAWSARSELTRYQWAEADQPVVAQILSGPSL